MNNNSGGISQSNTGSMDGGQQANIGDYAQQTMTTQATVPAGKSTQEEVVQMLAEIEHLIYSTSLPPDIKEEAITYLGAAKKATEKAEPKKQLVANNLEGMAETLKNASQIQGADKTLWEKAKPVLLKVTDWLGQAVAGSLLAILLT